MTDISDCFIDLEELANAFSIPDAAENKPQRVNTAIEALVKRKILQPKVKSELDPDYESKRFDVIIAQKSYGPRGKPPESVHPGYSFVGYIGSEQAKYLAKELEKRRNGLPKKWEFKYVGVVNFQK